jgi:hypothetical protein
VGAGGQEEARAGNHFIVGGVAQHPHGDTIHGGNDGVSGQAGGQGVKGRQEPRQ